MKFIMNTSHIMKFIFDFITGQCIVQACNGKKVQVQVQEVQVQVQKHQGLGNMYQPAVRDDERSRVTTSKHGVCMQLAS